MLSVVRHAAVSTFLLTSLPFGWSGGSQQGINSAVIQDVGAISGTVIDRNTGHPIKGAIVSLLSLEQPRFEAPSVVTDRLGRFVITPLPAGRSYYIRASKHGYADTAFSRIDRPDELGEPLQLEAREWRRVNLQMERFGAVEGRVVDALGRPVVGADVQAIAAIETLQGPQWASVLPSAKTDDRGTYAFALPPGKYRVLIPAAPLNLRLVTASIESGGRRFEFPLPSSDRRIGFGNLLYPSGDLTDFGSVIDLTNGGDHSLPDFTVEPAAGFSVAGRLTNLPSASKPIAVRLFPAGPRLPPSTAVATTNSGADGSFKFENVPEGLYRLDASSSVSYYQIRPSTSSTVASGAPPAAGHRPVSTDNLSLFSSPSAILEYLTVASSDTGGFGAMDLLVDRDVVGVQLHVYPLPDIEVSIRWDGRPQAPPPVGWLMLEPSDSLAGMPIASAVSGDAGRYLLKGIFPGSYFLRLGRRLPFAIKSVEYRGTDVAERPVSIDETTGRSDLVVTLTSAVAEFSGRVTGLAADSQPAVVLFFTQDSLKKGAVGLRPDRSGVVAVENGSFSVKGIPAGDYLLVATQATGRQDLLRPDTLNQLASRATRATVTWGGVTHVDLTIR